MKTRLVALLAMAIVVPGCFDDSPSPSSTFVPGSDTILKAARLSGRQEVPPNPSAATGEATVVVGLDRSSLRITVTFTGLVDTTDAHIHVGEPGADGPIILPLASGGYASPLVATLTQESFTPQASAGVTSFSQAIDAVLQGRTYVNLHTAAFPDGEIRGQVGPTTMIAQLDGLQEVPPVPTTAFGSMSLTLNNDQTMMSVSLDVAGLSHLTAAHIHAAPGQVDGPIIFPLAEGDLFAPLSRSLTEADLTPQPSAGVTTFPEAVDAVLSGNTYANVHTALYPDGEIRGQILSVQRAPPAPTTVPPTTPTTVTPPIPGYPNTGTTSLGIPTQGFPNTGMTTPSTFNPGIVTPGSPTGTTVTTGTTTTTPVVTGPFYSDSSALRR
jgi:hypothetical protein